MEENQQKKTDGLGERPGTMTLDKPVNRRGGMWRVIGAFLFGAVLTFAGTYFWLGGGESGQAETIAVVNGEEISQDAFIDRSVELGASQTAQILDGIITETLIQQKAEEENINLSEEDYDAEIASLKEQFGSDEAFDQALTQNGLDEETLREQMKTQLFLEKLLGAKLEVSEAEVQSYFEENKDQFGTPEQVTAKQIVVESEADAEAVLERLEGGEDFSEVAKDVSTDPQAQDNGGEMGTLTKGQHALSQQIPGIDETLFALDEGELSDPVESPMGFYIFQVNEKIPAEDAEFNEEIAQQITQTLEGQKLNEQAPILLQELQEEAEIKNNLFPDGPPAPQQPAIG